ncbi:MAG: hydroxymethylpyrimidine/phosphomethylpyrimidine kinase [Candidatus Eremiobacteraeota bacterium]|nr:hydroxymethylpyrimidine/phosphomethylpyrimidine kinase [Candidatus Eremiobacteraeota bacterium]
MEPALKAVVASIGSTHPWNIAGLGLDILVARELGVRSLSVTTGVTAQDESGLHARCAVPADIVRAQLEALPIDDLGALRIGAIPSVDAVSVVARFMRANAHIPAVVDPVYGASLEGMLTDESAYGEFLKSILPLPVVLTPNVPEAARLLNVSIEDCDSMLAAARAVQRLGPRAVLLKGGHLHGELCDVLVTGSQTKIFRETRLRQGMRGTGCVLAAALACRLALGSELTAAVAYARTYVRKKIAAQIPLASLRVAF